MKSRKKNRKIPDQIILDVLNNAYDVEKSVLDYYDRYIYEVSTEPVYSNNGNHAGYYYDEDLAQELRLALAQAIPALRQMLIKNHLDKQPVIIVLGQLTD